MRNNTRAASRLVPATNAAEAEASNRQTEKRQRSRFGNRLLNKVVDNDDTCVRQRIGDTDLPNQAAVGLPTRELSNGCSAGNGERAQNVIGQVKKGNVGGPRGIHSY